VPEQDASQRTEAPTPKRKEEARRKGQVARSREPATALAFFTLAAALAGGAASAAAELLGWSAQLWRGELALGWTPHGLAPLLREALQALLSAMLPFALPLLLLGVLAAILPGGFVFSTEPLRPQLSRISPIKGLQRIFSLRSLVELIKALLKIVLLGLIVAVVLVGAWHSMLRATFATPEGIMQLAARQAATLAALAGAGFALVALADALYQFWEHLRSLRMSKQELKEEHKETEGDPQIRARIRQLQSEMARRRMMSEVPKADVVITNPTHIAVALAYRPERDQAPRVVAKGKGKIAERIRQLAREHGVALRENPALARSLFAEVELGEEIPPALFEAVAIVLAEVFAERATKLGG